jgi:hypothetical protein
MADDPFTQYPVIIDLLDSNLKLQTRYLFLDDEAAAAVRKNNSSKLTSRFGKKYREVLGLLSGLGGDESDILDISELGISKKPAVTPIVAPEKKGELVARLEIITDIHLYPEDRVSEVKEKLSIALKIPIYKQYLFAETIGPLYYRITSDMAIGVNLEEAMRSKTLTMKLPVDDQIYQSRDSIQIEALDYFLTLGEIYNKWNIRHFKLVSLDSFIDSSRRERIAELSRTDEYQFQLLYYSFIMRFWPMLTLEVFKLLMTSEKEFSSAYPDLFTDTSLNIQKYQAEKEILNAKYVLLENLPADFRKYAPEQAHLFSRVSEKRIIDVSIRGSVLTVEPVSNTADLFSYIKLDVPNLFEKLHADANIPFIRAHLVVPHQGGVILTKVVSPKLAEGDPRDIPRIFEKIKYRLQMPINNSILLVIPIFNHHNGRGDSLYLILTIQESGRYQVRSSWGEEIQIDFSTMFNLVQTQINPVIKNINNLGRGVFSSINHLPLMDRGNAKFSNLHLDLFWKMPISADKFEALGRMLAEDAKSNIIQPSLAGHHVDQSSKSDLKSYNYQMLKGMTRYDYEDADLYTSNYYEYLTNAKVKQHWLQLFGEGRLMHISYRITDVKVEVYDLREQEFPYFYGYIIYLLYRLEKLAELKGTQKTKGERGKRDRRLGTRMNQLKVLKSRDPDLYLFKKFGSDVVYSRICQKSHQPLMYDIGEYENLDASTRAKAVKFWNYTTNQPVYYYCPNSKFPFLNFLVGYHPRGYCLPCCKKTPGTALVTDAAEGEGGKKNYVYNVCMTKHIHTEEDIHEGASRHIMSYGKTVDIGRIGQLPDIISKYLLYNLEDKEIILEEQTPKIWTFQGVRYDVHRLIKIVRHSRVKEMTVESLMDMLKKPFQEYLISKNINTPLAIIQKPELGADDYNKISNANTSQPLLLLRDDSGLHFIEGIYRLAKAYLVQNEFVNVRVITPHQLQKSALGVLGGKINKSGYYLFGVAQNNANVSNIGAGHSIAAALSMTLSEFVEKCIAYLREFNDRNYYRTLYEGNLGEYFGSLDDLLALMYAMFIDEEVTFTLGDQYPRKFLGWNELFIELAEVCFGKKVILLDDTSIDITGTSFKASKISENIEIILRGLENATNVIPEPSAESVHEYILLLRKKRRSKALFSSNYIYHAIFIFTPKVFFKNFHIEKRIFTHRDEIVKLLRKVILETVAKMPRVEEPRVASLRLLQEFLSSSNYVTEKYYVNRTGMCYAVNVTGKSGAANKGSFVWPIRASMVPASEKDKIDNNPYSRRDSNLDYVEVYKLFTSYNHFLVTKAEEAGAYQLSSEESEYSYSWNMREKAVTPASSYIKIDKFILYEDRIIGLISNGYYYYFKELAYSNKNYEALVKRALGGYALLTEGFKRKRGNETAYKLLYDPDKVNTALVTDMHSLAKAQPKSSLQRALYKKYLYNLFVIEVIGSLDYERNIGIRKKLTELISRTDFRRASALDDFQSSLNKILEHYLEDAEQIQNSITHILNETMERKYLQDILTREVYHFDRTTLQKWSTITSKKEMVAAVRKVADSAVYIGKLGDSGHDEHAEIFPSVFVPCSSSSQKQEYCKQHKLLVDKKDYDTLVDLLADDILNPLKREYLLSSIILQRTREHFNFSKKIGEEIYIKYYSL